MRLFRIVLVLTATSFVASTMFLHDATRYLAHTNVALAPRLSALNNFSRPSAVDNDTVPYVELRVPASAHRVSFVESLRVHSPFIATRASATGLFHALQLPNETLRCARPDAVPHASAAVCNSFLYKQDHLHTREFKFHTRPAPTARTVAALADNTLYCLDASLLVVELGPRDHNTRTWLQRLLLVWHVVARADASPGWLGPIAPHRVVALLCPDAYCMGMLNGQPGRGSPFHIGALQALLLPPSRGTDVVVARSLPAALDGLHAHATRGRAPPTDGPDTLCLRSAVHVLGFDARFAFADAELGARMGWHGAPSRTAPHSSDLVEARRAAFQPVEPPPMRAKLLYVRRAQTQKRRWTAGAELTFAAVLRRVANRTGVAVDIVDSEPRRPTPFVVRVARFADAAVVVGLHGSALSLAAFAPPAAHVVEIEPAYHHRVPLFGTLQAVGVQHQYFALANSTNASQGWASELPADEEKRLEDVLVQCAEEAVRENKLKVVTDASAETASGGTITVNATRT